MQMRTTIRAFTMTLGLATSTMALATGPTARIAAERLDRGAVALPAQGGGMLITWRLLTDDPATIRFRLLRDGKPIHDSRVGEATAFVDKKGSANSPMQCSGSATRAHPPPP